MGAVKVHEFTTVDGVVDVPMWTADDGFPDDLAAPFFNDTQARRVLDPHRRREPLAQLHRDRRLRRRAHPRAHPVGGRRLVRQRQRHPRARLLADGLVDELHLYVYPVAVGTGLRLFPDGAPQIRLALVDVERLSNGVAHVTYGPAA